MPQCIFVTNQAVVLSSAARHPRITAQEMDGEISINERAARKIIKDLVDAGCVSKIKEAGGNLECQAGSVHKVTNQTR